MFVPVTEIPESRIHRLGQTRSLFVLHLVHFCDAEVYKMNSLQAHEGNALPNDMWQSR